MGQIIGGGGSGGGGGDVTSVFTRTGAVVAANGDYSTNQVTENTNLYYTNARGIGSVLTGYTSGAGTVAATDTILQAVNKLNGNIVVVDNKFGSLTTNYIPKWNGTALANTVMFDDGTNIGIGKTTMSYKLDIAGSINLDETGCLYIAGNKVFHYEKTTSNTTLALSGNTFFGYNNALSIGNASNNTSFGFSALAALTTGAGNTAVGASAGIVIVGGARNTTIGQTSGRVLSSGSDCTFVGMESGYLVTTGGQNTYIGAGSNAGSGTLTGAANTGLGYSAGQWLKDGSAGNIHLGAYSGLASTGSLSYSAAIGYDCHNSTSNEFMTGGRIDASMYLTYILGSTFNPTSVTSGQTITIRLGHVGGVSSNGNKAANNLELGAGVNYGDGSDSTSGGNGSVIIKTTNKNAASGSLNTYTNRLYVAGGTGNVSVGGAPSEASAILQLISTTQGFLPPKMTTAQRDAISSPTAGLLVFNTTTSAWNGYNGAAWTEFLTNP